MKTNETTRTDIIGATMFLGTWIIGIGTMLVLNYII